eukprot:scaffold4511_cov171-Amphora_coffeaeformis.AAC.15
MDFVAVLGKCSSDSHSESFVLFPHEGSRSQILEGRVTGRLYYLLLSFLLLLISFVAPSRKSSSQIDGSNPIRQRTLPFLLFLLNIAVVVTMSSKPATLLVTKTTFVALLLLSLVMWPRVLIVGTLALSPSIPSHAAASAGDTTSSSSTSSSTTTATKRSSLAAYPALSSTTALFSSSSSSSRSKNNNKEPGSDSERSSCSVPAPLPRGALATSPYSLGAFSLDKYHLIWSPHAWKKLVGTSIVLLLLPRFQHAWRPAFWAHVPTFSATAGWYQNLVLPLAASSCCLLQLGLNVLSVGCAGWNTYLGPVRPYFLGILLVSSWRHRLSCSWTTLLWRSTVALLPEIVHGYNLWQTQRYEQQQQDVSTLTEKQYIVELEVPTMGCVACISNIDASLRNVPGVRRASSALQPLGAKGGTATVVLAADDEDAVASMTQRIVRAVAEAGFDGAVVTSIQPQKNQESKLTDS